MLITRPLLRIQGWQECLGNGDVAEEVDLEQASPLVDREGLDRR